MKIITCHQLLSLWIHYNDNAIKTTTITPEQIDQNGLLPRLSSTLNSIGVSMLYDKQINGYQGFKLAFNDILNISKIESNYYFAWMMDIIHKYDEGKSAQDKLLLFRKSPPHDILLGLYSPSSSTPPPSSMNILSAKTIYPLFNGGINRITISSDLLATSQYINSHKTATIAKFQIGPSTNSQMNPVEISNSFDWKHEYFYFTMKKHEQHVPFIFPNDLSPMGDPEYLPHILPDTFTSFHCNSGLLSNCFEIISIHAPSSGQQIQNISKPLDTQFRNRAGELRINMNVLNTTSNQWLIEIETCIVPQATYITPQVTDSEFHNKINFAILDQYGNLLTSSMHSRLYTIQNAKSISTQTVKQTFFHTIDIKKMKQKYPTSKYSAIRLYARSSIGQPFNSQYQGKLRLIPLFIFGNVELIQEKFSSAPMNK